MKKKLSLNILLHNDKLMMGLSLVIAIVVWALVVNGPANVKTKTIRKDAAIDLTDTYAENNNIRVIETPDLAVEITVSGPRSVIDYLGGEDITVKAETYLIQTAGPAVLNISVSKTNKNADFEITGYTPSTVTVQCDYWDTVDLPVRMDISSVQVEDPDTQQLGEPMLDRTYFQNSMVKLEGPRATVSRITSIVARVEADKPIGTVQVYAARLVALDADGNEVDLKGCQMLNPSTGEPIQSETVNVTVPVYIHRTIDFTYNLLHVPPAIASNPNLVALSATSITLVGPKESVDSAAGVPGQSRRYRLRSSDAGGYTPRDSSQYSRGRNGAGEYQRGHGQAGHRRICRQNTGHDPDDRTGRGFPEPAGRSVNIRAAAGDQQYPHLRPARHPSRRSLRRI